MNTWNQFQTQFKKSKLSSSQLSQLYHQYGAGLGSLPAPKRRQSSARDTEDMRRKVLFAQASQLTQPRSRSRAIRQDIMERYHATYRSPPLNVPEPMIQQVDDLYN